MREPMRAPELGVMLHGSVQLADKAQPRRLRQNFRPGAGNCTGRDGLETSPFTLPPPATCRARNAGIRPPPRRRGHFFDLRFIHLESASRKDFAWVWWERNDRAPCPVRLLRRLGNVLDGYSGPLAAKNVFPFRIGESSRSFFACHGPQLEKPVFSSAAPGKQKRSTTSRCGTEDIFAQGPGSIPSRTFPVVEAALLAHGGSIVPLHQTQAKSFPRRALPDG